MEEVAKGEGSHLSSAASFVEGGVQDSCDDACSICLDAFTESDPSTVTTCKHEFHLQCILDWCQRSSQCPMCWQELGFKDSTSQDIFEGVVQERNMRLNQERNTNVFHHPALVDFELQHLPVGRGGEIQINEYIFQQLAAAAAMGRSHHIVRRDGQQGRSGSHGRPQFLVFSTHPNASSVDSGSPSSTEGGDEDSGSSTPVNIFGGESSGHSPRVSAQTRSSAVLTPGTSMTPGRISISRNANVVTTPVGPDRPGPSDLQSFSESLKSRLNAVSMRYKESITKSTRGWRERFFSRNNSTAGDLGSEVKREANAMATVSRMMDALETRESRRNSGSSTSPATEAHNSVEPSNEEVNQNNASTLPNGSLPCISFVATTGSQ